MFLLTKTNTFLFSTKHEESLRINGLATTRRKSVEVWQGFFTCDDCTPVEKLL